MAIRPGNGFGSLDISLEFVELLGAFCVVSGLDTGVCSGTDPFDGGEAVSELPQRPVVDSIFLLDSSQCVLGIAWAACTHAR